MEPTFFLGHQWGGVRNQNGLAPEGVTVSGNSDELPCPCLIGHPKKQWSTVFTGYGPAEGECPPVDWICGSLPWFFALPNLFWPREPPTVKSRGRVLYTFVFAHSYSRKKNWGWKHGPYNFCFFRCPLPFRMEHFSSKNPLQSAIGCGLLVCFINT